MQTPTPTSSASLSLTSILWYKVLKWLNHKSSSALTKFLARALCVIAITVLTFAPNYALGYLTAVLQWNSYRIPLFILALVCTLNAHKFIRGLRQVASSSFQHKQGDCFLGVAVPDLANFLQETQAFKKEESISRLGLSQGQYFKIARELESRGILVRGEANARVLRNITREDLVTELTGDIKIIRPAFSVRLLDNDTVPLRRAQWRQEHSPTLSAAMAS